jgi:hypothetical protein
VQAKNNHEISVGEISIPRKGVGYFVRFSGDPFAGKSGLRPDQYLCKFSRSGEMGQARVVENALGCLAVGCCAVGLRPDAGELWEISFQLIYPQPDDRGEELYCRMFRVARCCKWGGISKRQARLLTHLIFRFRACTRWRGRELLALF